MALFLDFFDAFIDFYYFTLIWGYLHAPGCSQIGEILYLKESTVKFHINHIFSKLGVNDRTQAAIAALKRGIASL